MSTLRSRQLISLAALGTAAAVAGTLALSAAAGAAPATGPVVLTAGTPVPGSWVVTLKDTAGADVGTAAAGLAARYAGLLGLTFSRAVPGFSVRMSESDARRLAADPRVAAVEQDAVVRAADTQPTGAGTWGLDRIDQRLLPLSGSYSYPATAAGVRAYVIDTGIRTSHADFGGRASVGYDAVGDGRAGQDCDGHGTHVAGILGGRTYGVAKGVSLVAVRTLDCAGEGTTAQVIASVDWVTRNAVAPAVANLSLGLDGRSATLDRAVRASIAAGVTYAVAAGNSAADACAVSPSSTAEAITVGASTTADARATFSNTGACVDLFAPGKSVLSDWAAGDTATATVSGTSMSAPHVAGAAALYLAAHPAATPAAVRAALVGAATPGVLTDAGTGSPNLLLYAAPTGTPDPTPPPGPTPTATPTRAPGLPMPPRATTAPPAPPSTTVPVPPVTTTPATPPAGTTPATTTPPSTTPPSTTPPSTTPPGTPPSGTANDTDVAIPDLGTGQSSIAVTGRTGRAPATLRVAVRVVHPYRGDLLVELVAPDGRSYRLKNPSAYDRAVNFEATVPVNASASPLAGTWTLRVRDVYTADTGYLDRWSLLL